MPTLDGALHLLQAHGLWLLFPLATVEGPIVTVLAAYLARLGHMNLLLIYWIVVAADLFGDAVFYWVGRVGHGSVPERWRHRLGLDPVRQAALEEHFHHAGGRTLIIGKLTHAAGLLVLLSAGSAQMPFGRFMLYNTIGTLPKSLFFLLLGYSLGAAYTAIDSWIFRASIIVVAAMLVGALLWFLHRRAKRT
jgi:membrane protein DedA with SNARE-associated domain